MREGREAAAVRVARRVDLIVPQLVVLERAVRVELVGILAPQLRAPVPTDGRHLDERALGQQDLRAVRALDVVVVRELPEGAVGDDRPEPQRLRDALRLFAETVESESRQQSAAQADRFCTHPPPADLRWELLPQAWLPCAALLFQLLPRALSVVRLSVFPWVRFFFVFSFSETG